MKPGSEPLGKALLAEECQVQRSCGSSGGVFGETAKSWSRVNRGENSRNVLVRDQKCDQGTNQMGVKGHGKNFWFIWCAGKQLEGFEQEMASSVSHLKEWTAVWLFICCGWKSWYKNHYIRLNIDFGNVDK